MQMQKAQNLQKVQTQFKIRNNVLRQPPQPQQQPTLLKLTA
jgi:hypothetical protein